MHFNRRRHRWIALLALLGLLFQQVAMATYVCPQLDAVATVQVTDHSSPCREPDTTDQVRCHQHCHPAATSTDHAPPLVVPAAMLPATTWLRIARADTGIFVASAQFAISARGQSPPLNIQHCTFQI